MSKFSAVLNAKRPAPDAGDGTSPRRGRPPAKRSDPEYVQTTAYIRKQTLQEVKIALLQQGSERDFSELVEELLADWLRRKS